MKRRLTNTTFFDGYTTTGESDTTVLLDYTGAGGWNVLPDFAPTDAAQARQEIENAALEKAAKVCEQPTDEVQTSESSSMYIYKDCFGCAAAIRAMKVEK